MPDATHYDPATKRYWLLRPDGALFVWQGYWRCWNSEGYHQQSNNHVKGFTVLCLTPSKKLSG